MGDALKLISFENPVFCCYLTYASILALKMMMMSILTSRQRIKHGVIGSPEDAHLLKGKTARKSHEDVDRVRRAHLNDMENIPLFFVIGFTYVLTNPSVFTALCLFRTYTVARLIHTFVYAIYVVPQPARGTSWLIAFLITGYMAVMAISTFSKF